MFCSRYCLILLSKKSIESQDFVFTVGDFGTVSLLNYSKNFFTLSQKMERETRVEEELMEVPQMGENSTPSGQESSLREQFSRTWLGRRVLETRGPEALEAWLAQTESTVAVSPSNSAGLLVALANLLTPEVNPWGMNLRQTMNPPTTPIIHGTSTVGGQAMVMEATTGGSSMAVETPMPLRGKHPMGIALKRPPNFLWEHLTLEKIASFEAQIRAFLQAYPDLDLSEFIEEKVRKVVEFFHPVARNPGFWSIGN